MITDCENVLCSIEKKPNILLSFLNDSLLLLLINIKNYIFIEQVPRPLERDAPA